MFKKPKNHKNIIVTAIIIIFIIAAVLSYFMVYYYPKNPGKVTQNFYKWYQNYSKKSNPLIDKAYRANRYLSVNLIEKMDILLATYQSGDQDPFICEQEMPQEFIYYQPVTSPKTASIMITSKYENKENKFRVNLRLIDKKWKIESIDCLK